MKTNLRFHHSEAGLNTKPLLAKRQQAVRTQESCGYNSFLHFIWASLISYLLIYTTVVEGPQVGRPPGPQGEKGEKGGVGIKDTWAPSDLLALGVFRESMVLRATKAAWVPRTLGFTGTRRSTGTHRSRGPGTSWV